ncbi:MAG: ammonium transporter [Rhodospirillales bacterium]
MENEIGAVRVLLSQGFLILSLLLAILAPAGLALAAMGRARYKHRFTGLSWMILLFPLTAVATYLFGWLVYHVFAGGPGITEGLRDAWRALPWAETMGPGFIRDEGGDYSDLLLRLLAFMAFAWFAACLLAGAVQERIKGGGLMILALLLAGFFYPIGAAWGWSLDGWMVALIGFHDAFGLALLSTLAGGFTLGVLVVLKPRIASRTSSGELLTLPGHSDGLVIAGLSLVIAGLFGLAMMAIEPATALTLGESRFFAASSVYGAPVPMGGLLLNLVMAASAGLLIGHVLTGGDLRGTLAISVAAVVGISPGGDLYHPLESFLLGLLLAWLCHRSHRWLEKRFHLDDVSGTVAFHGFAGFWGLVIGGVLLWGYPSSLDPEFAGINPFGQAAGALLLFWLLGFLPGYLGARILEFFDALRLAEVVELSGLDLEALRRTEQSRYELHRQEGAYVEDLIKERQ